MIPCYLTVYEQVTWLKEMVVQCERLGLCPILLDNGSSYPPLARYLRTCKYQVIRVGSNAGCYGFWHSHRQNELNGYYIVSDSDLDLNGVPDDAVQKLIEAFELNTDVTKAALSLEINDIPQTYEFYHLILKWENSYWVSPRPGNCFFANTGATFALYHTKRNHLVASDFYKAVRLDKPYTARHLPWYLDLKALNEEMLQYHKKCDNVAYYGSKIRDLLETNK